MRWPWRRHPDRESEQAIRDAERKLRHAKQDWDKVNEAHDRLANWIESALHDH